MKITVVGTGYVGLVTAAIFASFNNQVYGLDIDQEKIDTLKKGKVFFYEPGLEELVQSGIDKGNLHFTTSYKKAVPESEVIFICVGTPPKKNGDYDLKYVLSSAESIAKNLKKYSVVTVKSTVPPGTNDKVKEVMDKNTSVSYDLAACPEFLREGSAVEDSLNPSRIVIGTDSEKAKEKLLKLHKQIKGPRLVTDVSSAQLIKYASNAFLATKISYINFLARLCDKVGADINEVSKGLGMDPRISSSFLRAGIGYGGSCFPKDTWALIRFAKRKGEEFTFLKQVDNVNKTQVEYFLNKAEKLADDSLQSKKVTVLGLSFKPETDDMREAQSIPLINGLNKRGAKVTATDPVAIKNAQNLIEGIKYEKDVYKALENSEMLILVTEWDKYKNLDFKKVKKLMNKPVVLDGRNIYNPDKMKKLGFVYKGVGQ